MAFLIRGVVIRYSWVYFLSLKQSWKKLGAYAIVKYNSGTGQGQSEKSGTVPDVPGQLGTMGLGGSS